MSDGNQIKVNSSSPFTLVWWLLLLFGRLASALPKQVYIRERSSSRPSWDNDWDYADSSSFLEWVRESPSSDLHPIRVTSSSPTLPFLLTSGNAFYDSFSYPLL